MCQGHEDANTAATPAAPSGQAQPPQFDGNRTQKPKNKPPNNPAQNNSNSPAPKKKSSLPTYQLLKLASSKLANGHAYVDTHCHTYMTVEMYQNRAKGTDPQIPDIPAFINEFFPAECASIVDVFCEPPFPGWKDLADQEDLPLKYCFAVGCHPHHAKEYTDESEKVILEAMKHPKCVAWGEMGLDYHYNHSPQDIQRSVLIRQIKHAVALNKNIVIHTREADDDILRILKEHVPPSTHLHVHCFTDSPSLAASILSHFPNSYIGITGVITYASNQNTTEVVKATPLERLLLETDSPYMTPNNVHKGIKAEGGKSTRINVCWSGMIPFTAAWIAEIKGVEVERVLDVTTQNAMRMYGIGL